MRQTTDPRPMTLSFDEITSWEQFENLAASYFELQNGIEGKGSVKNTVKQSGKGADGGIDILVELQMEDLAVSFKRKWIVQCKFYDRDLRKSDLSEVNIPTLIKQYNADGYLLITKKGIVNTLQKSFDELDKNCNLGYRYEIWTDRTFINKILRTDNVILEQYFPKYYKHKYGK